MFTIFIIFLAEVCVVTVGTLRIIFVSRGHRFLAPMLGFCEITMWLFAMRQIMQNLDDLGCFLGFALGFTLGNFLGIIIDKKLALGTLKVHVITQRNSDPLLQDLRGSDFGATRIPGHGATGPVNIIMTVIRRKQLHEVLGIIRGFDPDAFYAVDELQITSAGIFPLSQSKAESREPESWRPMRQFDPREMAETAAGERP
jgi:uncharacterized protein YebE (UPF0316 family)